MDCTRITSTTSAVIIIKRLVWLVTWKVGIIATSVAAIAADVVSELTIYPSPDHYPLYPLMKYSVTTRCPYSFC
jgi:hypothetical protein